MRGYGGREEMDQKTEYDEIGGLGDDGIRRGRGERERERERSPGN